MRDLLDYRTTARTLMKDTAKLDSLLTNANIKLALEKESSNEWAKVGLSAKTALNGSLEINKRLEKDLDTAGKKVKRNRGFSIGGCGTVLVAVVTALVKVFYFR